MAREPDPQIMRLADWRQGLIMVCLTVVIISLIQLHQNDVEWCQDTFQAMMRGDARVLTRIDWEHFTAMEQDVGKAYTALLDEEAQQLFQYAFLMGAASVFKQTPARVTGKLKWRLVEKEGARIMVAADAINPELQSTFVFTISTESGRRQLEAITLLPPQRR